MVYTSAAACTPSRFIREPCGLMRYVHEHAAASA
jgi:hypothetical protein